MLPTEHCLLKISSSPLYKWIFCYFAIYQSRETDLLKMLTSLLVAGKTVIFKYTEDP